MTVMDERVPRVPLERTSSGGKSDDAAEGALLLRAASCADDMDDFDMRHLRYFLAVVRAGTVSAAAQSLHISQPSLSQQIRRLERRIGASLFIRSSRGVELTSGGRAFLREIQGIPGQLKSAIAAAAPAPTVWSVGVCGGAPARVLADVQDGMAGHGDAMRAVPQLHMRSVTSAHQLELLQHGELSFGIVRLPIAAPHLLRAVVWDEPLGIVVRTGHPFAGRPTVTWDDLATQRLLWYGDGCAPGYADTVPVKLAALGWNPVLHPVDHDQQALFVHALQTTRDLVALRPQAAVHGVPQLTWLPLPTARAPRERVALTALAGSRQAHVLRRVAARRDWPLLG